MAGKIDIGGYFDRLTARIGRRRDDGVTAAPSPSPTVSEVEETPRSEGARHDDGVVRHAIGRGRSGVKRTADRAKETARRATRRGRQPELPPEGVVAIEYSPRLDGDPDPGEVVWAWVPFEDDPSQGKDRPVVIIGRRGSKLVGIPLTTKSNDREAQLNMGTGGWDPKRRTSYARIWRMLDVDPTGARREGSVLDVQRFEALVRAVDKYYDVTVPAKRRRTRRADPADDYDY